MKAVFTVIVALVCISLAGYARDSVAQTCDSGTFDGAFAGEVVVPQNWNCDERQEFWFTDQGSQVLPYYWFLHLEQVGTTDRFVDPANLDRYRYLPLKPTEMNPDGLPIGFTRGNAKANEAYGEISDNWLGMTCAACHTGQVEFNGAKFLIDGAPAMADFEGLIHDLVAAMKATLADAAKFERFAAAVTSDRQALKGGGTGDPNELRAQLETITKIRSDWNGRNKGKSPYGHARLDAIGAIFNETAAIALGDLGNVISAAAPVSYPFIWDTPQHDKVQWNGSVKNAGPGALGRNVGEVLGVFGALDLNTRLFSRRGHANSVNIVSLGRLEELVSRLESPQWSDTTLPPIAQTELELGRKVFEDLCIDCHHDINRSDPRRTIEAQMLPIGDPNDENALRTDPAMAVGFLTKTARAPQLTRRFTRYWGVLSDFKTFKPAERNKTSEAKILGYTVIGAITRAFFEDPRATIEAVKAGKSPKDAAEMDRLAGDVPDKADKSTLRKLLIRLAGLIQPAADPDKKACFPEGLLACYKARPLNGIWATAPYLHNGSVRTMRQLLLPAAQRETSFKVGSREFDPVDMGFTNEGASTLDTSLDGNRNTGHDGPSYGNDVLSDDPAKMDALLEYLKTL